MNYIRFQDKNISKISAGHQKWYQANSSVWGERYMKEKEHILTRERSKKETRIIVKYLPQKCKKILDAPCGYGRISNSLSALGYEVTGIDISDYFINLARKQATQKGLKVSYIAGDILKKKVLGKFDVVLNIFTSLGYLENDKKNELFIEKLCQHVKSGGGLIIETINPIALIANYKKKETITLKDGTRLYFERILDFRTSTSVTKIQEVKQNSNPRNLVHIIRIYYPHELINICRKFGCNLVEMLDQNGKAKDIKNSLRIWLIFKKK
ncbi:methyltransferase domain-containing protein [Patescibacteria group bacterium]|nr:methyltransferase domain-containing protein [Patescibacteria group bacterium]MBU4162234.1 methyltransferase domain-containing protein [Patescibacteria group bacterium]